MVLKDAEQNGELCLGREQLNCGGKRGKGSHSPGHTDQKKNWGERGIFCQLHCQLFSLQLQPGRERAARRVNASSRPHKITHFLISEKCNARTDSDP